MFIVYTPLWIRDPLVDFLSAILTAVVGMTPTAVSVQPPPPSPYRLGRVWAEGESHSGPRVTAVEGYLHRDRRSPCLPVTKGVTTR